MVGFKDPPKHTQFKKGNPGKPKGVKHSSTIIRELLALKDTLEDGTVVGREYRVYDAVIQEAIAGNIQAFNSLIDRLEGKPKQETTNVNIDVSHDDWILAMNKKTEE